jgi:predicted MFS family arabinose efflux permease
MKLKEFGTAANELVLHPRHFLPARREGLARWNGRILDWLAEHVLASMLMFDIALIVPLIAIPLSDSVKITLGVISGSWIQWWALPALQRSQVRAEKERAAKMDADHLALTHIANTVDAIMARMDAQAKA